MRLLFIIPIFILISCQSQDEFLDEACSCKIEIDETKREWVTFYYRGCDYCCQVMSIPLLKCRTPAMQDSVGRQFLRELYGRKPHCDPSNEYAITDEILRAKGLRTIVGKAE